MEEEVIPVHPFLHEAETAAVAKEFSVGVEEQPWARECYLTDPDRNRLRVGTPKP